MTDPGTQGGFSELVLADRLISLAQDADRAGFQVAARRLIRLACDVFEETEERSSH